MPVSVRAALQASESLLQILALPVSNHFAQIVPLISYHVFLALLATQIFQVIAHHLHPHHAPTQIAYHALQTLLHAKSVPPKIPLAMA
jgi:hypothetical protein